MKKINLTQNGKIDSGEWKIMELPLGDNKVFRHEEPHAQIIGLNDGTLEIVVEQYTQKGLPGLQQTDTGKHFYMSSQSFKLPKTGIARFYSDMAAEPIGMDGQNYQDGFIITILFDENNALIFDSATTGRRFYSIYEKLVIPGLIKPEDAFTYIIEAPYVAAPKPMEWHTHMVEFDMDKKSVKWFVDGHKTNEIFRAEAMPESIKFGIGLFSLKPYINRQSVSIQGQGMKGQWKNIRAEL